ncbi:RNA polymerase sigma-70 factor [uncultured Draconibacterium sp.]|uniref:RNA polymerase sigma-70 factor n=1 Tax=uncultured Draconibacterium sp. TaxID=1573823 RepID=UPI002AA6D2F6|nr:RNA polymerase sigma-70 factor [uncultured Draconibacterium sp.]
MDQFEAILRLEKGDRDAFKIVFDTYYKSICLFIGKYITDPDQVEDLAQDVFVSIWEKKLPFENLSAFKSYLYQTAKNKSLNLLEHEAVKKGYREKAIRDQKTTDNFYNLNFIENETQRLIYKTLKDLPPRAREILIMQLEGFKNDEIAEKLQISVYTVKNHKASAYKYLKQNLKLTDVLILVSALLCHIR